MCIYESVCLCVCTCMYACVLMEIKPPKVTMLSTKCIYRPRKTPGSGKRNLLLNGWQGQSK